MKKAITMNDLRKQGMREEVERHFSCSDYNVYQTDVDEFEVYSGNDFVHSWPSIAKVIEVFEEMYAEDVAADAEEAEAEDADLEEIFERCVDARRRNYYETEHFEYRVKFDPWCSCNYKHYPVCEESVLLRRNKRTALVERVLWHYYFADKVWSEAFYSDRPTPWKEV